jgi:hypothetical protein
MRAYPDDFIPELRSATQREHCFNATIRLFDTRAPYQLLRTQINTAAACPIVPFFLTTASMLAMEYIEQMDAHIAHELAHRHLFEFVDDDFFALCARRNALTPFCRLSDDILIQIIKKLQDLCFQAHVKPRYSHDWFTWSLPGPDVAQWTQVNLVCSRIRQLTAGTRELWRVWNLDTTGAPKLHLEL